MVKKTSIFSLCFLKSVVTRLSEQAKALCTLKRHLKDKQHSFGRWAECDLLIRL